MAITHPPAANPWASVQLRVVHRFVAASPSGAPAAAVAMRTHLVGIGRSDCVTQPMTAPAGSYRVPSRGPGVKRYRITSRALSTTA